MLEREAKLLRADHTQQQQIGWLIWLTLCKTSKYDDKKREKNIELYRQHYRSASCGEKYFTSETLPLGDDAG